MNGRPVYSVTLEIPVLPKTLNEALRSHWTSYVRDSQRVGDALAYSLVGKKPEAPLKTVAVSIERHSSGILDRDNKFFTAKHVLDNLVKLGVLENDTEEIVRELSINQVKIKRELPKKLIVTIKELDV